MMNMLKTLRRAKPRSVAKDQSGVAAIEFALLSPLFFIMFFGLFQVSVYLQNYNAVRAVATDGARYVMVEYQKNNKVTDKQIESTILGLAVNPPYMLDTDRLSVTIDRSGTSRIAGTSEVVIDIDYTLNDFLPGIDLPISTIKYERPVFVVE